MFSFVSLDLRSHAENSTKESEIHEDLVTPTAAPSSTLNATVW